MLKRIGWWLRGRIDGGRVEWNVDEDIRTHIELDAERLRSEGMDAGEALREAERRFGDPGPVRAEMLRIASGPRGRRTAPSAGRMWTHVRHATRALLAARGSTALVAGTLAAAVGLTTLTVTLGRTVLLGAGGVEDPSRVVSLHSYFPDLAAGLREQPLHGSFLEPIEAQGGFASLAAFKATHFNLTGRGTPRRLDGLLTTPRLFGVSGVHPLLGPGFDDADRGDDRVVVISWRLWTDAFGADPAVVGSALVLNDEPYEVVGVMPAGFEFPRGEDVPATFRFPSHPDVWVPFEPPTRGPMDLGVVARLEPGVTVASLQPRLDAAVDVLTERFGRPAGFSFQALELREQAVGRVRPAILLLLVATGLLMLVAMGNVTGVGVARSEARVRDLAVRTAIGAGRRGVAAFLGAESLVLGLVSGALGVGIAAGLAAVVRGLAPEGIPGIDQVHVGPAGVALSFALAMAGAACLVLGPLSRMLGWRLSEVLKGARQGGSLGARRTGNALVAIELAVTLVLLAGSLVLTRSALNLLRVDPGFDADGVLAAEITLPEATYPDAARAAAVQRAEWPGPPDAAVPGFQRRLIQRLVAHPDIEAAAFANPLPFSGGQEASVFWADGMDPPPRAPLTEYTVTTEGYFHAMGIAVLEGREFDGSETFDSEPVAIVSRSLAAMFPHGQALGRRIKLGGAEESPYPWMRVVGVVGDVKRADLTSDARPELYVPVSQGGYTSQSTSRLVVRTTNGLAPGTALGRVRAVLAELDPDVPLDNVAPMTDLVANAAARSRFTATLTVGFSALALLITTLGLYSVISFSAATRHRELAVRTAMGATGGDVAFAVLAETLQAGALGLALGVLGMALGARALEGLVFGVAPLSPSALGGAVLLLCVTVALAAQGPVRACMRVDPVRILSRD